MHGTSDVGVAWSDSHWSTSTPMPMEAGGAGGLEDAVAGLAGDLEEDVGAGDLPSGSSR